jgi:hypothetical protein
MTNKELAVIDAVRRERDRLDKDSADLRGELRTARAEVRKFVDVANNNAKERNEAWEKAESLTVALRALLDAVPYHHLMCRSLDMGDDAPCNCNLGKNRAKAEELLAVGAAA